MNNTKHILALLLEGENQRAIEKLAEIVLIEESSIIETALHPEAIVASVEVLEVTPRGIDIRGKVMYGGKLVYVPVLVSWNELPS